MAAEAQSPDPLVLEHMTWPEVELALTRGMTTVVVPVGAVEQHGPHLPLCVDAERGTALGHRITRALGDALLAPTIRVGCSEHHMGFAGTITLTPETLEAVCRDYCTSLARHGFREIYLVPSHGGNFRVLEKMVPRLQEAVDAVDPECRVVAFTDLLGIIAVWRWVVEEEAGLGRRVGGHADIAEASEILHLHPELVRLERAEKGTVGDLDQEKVDRIFAKGLRAIAPNGILGDARGMDAELGERLLDAAARVIVQAFREEGEAGGSGAGAGSGLATLASSDGGQGAHPEEEGDAEGDPFGDDPEDALDGAEELDAELFEGRDEPEEEYEAEEYLEEAGYGVDEYDDELFDDPRLDDEELH